jgi:hypothetical protein
MAVLKRYVPEPTQIKDYRDRGGVYYEAQCEQCSRIFYPKRGTAKYCSKMCGIEYRNGGIITKKANKGSDTTQKDALKPSVNSLNKENIGRKKEVSNLERLKARLAKKTRIKKGK